MEKSTLIGLGVGITLGAGLTFAWLKYKNPDLVALPTREQNRMGPMITFGDAVAYPLTNPVNQSMALPFDAPRDANEPHYLYDYGLVAQPKNLSAARVNTGMFEDIIVQPY